MSIKKSSLEKKWYYRLAKVIFVWAPLILVVAAVFLVIFADVRGTGKDIATVLQNDVVYIVYGIIVLIFYFLILKGIWRGFLYIAFGGLEDDMKKKNVETGHLVATASGVSAVTSSDRNQIVGWVLMLIVLGCIYYAYFVYKSPSPIHINGDGGTKSTQCIPTGCGSLWRCDGSYYSDGVKRSVNGCYSSKTQATTLPSWSGTCRQCP